MQAWASAQTMLVSDINGIDANAESLRHFDSSYASYSRRFWYKMKCIGSKLFVFSIPQ
jgi:hypothetical protein